MTLNGERCLLIARTTWLTVANDVQAVDGFTIASIYTVQTPCRPHVGPTLSQPVRQSLNRMLFV